MTKTIEQINEKIKDGKAVVVTAEEIIDIVKQKGLKKAAQEVDVVTTGTFGPMCSSGVYLNIGHSKPRIKLGGGKAYLNDVPAYTGLAAMDALEGVTLNAPDYDMLPYLVDGTLALTARDGVLDADGPGASPRLVQGGELAVFLDRAARGTRLRAALALAEGSGGLAFAMPGAGLKQDLARLRGTSEGDACADPQTDPTPITAPITAGHCDHIWLTLSNGSSTARDVTVLYVDREFHITPIWPAPGLSNRIAFGEAQEVGMLIQNPSQRGGAEEIIVLSVPARDGAPRTVLTALADPETARDLTSGDALSGWLGAALTPDESSRNFSFSGAIPALEITRHRINLHGGT